MTALSFIDAPSPNHDERGAPVELIILHYTGMKTGQEALARLCDPAAKVSAHYLVEEDGRVFRLVDEERRAWHAGRAFWRGATDINARSVGIEIVNPGHEWGYRAFPVPQIERVCALVHSISARCGLSASAVLGHSDVAPGRKEDPGELFPWAQLARAGLAVGPHTANGDPEILADDALSALADIGYEAPRGAHAAALLAFQRRFRPDALGQGLSPETKAALLWAREMFR